MIDTDKYEDAKKVVQDAGLIDENDGHPDIHYRKIALLLTEVKRLREELDKAEQKRDKYCGALDLAIEWIGYTGMGMEYEERIRQDEGITVYGDEYLTCDCEGCSGLVKDKYDDYIIKGRGSQESVKCDFDECPYF